MEKELAAAVGVSQQMLRRYRRAGCMGATAEEVNAWRKANLDATRGGVGGNGSPAAGDGVGGASGGSGGNYKLWRARREKAMALKARLEVEERRASLLSAADVRRELVEWAVMLRTRIASIPDELAAVAPQELKAPTKRIAEASIRQALKNAYEAAVVGLDRVDDLILAEADRIRAERAAG